MKSFTFLFVCILLMLYNISCRKDKHEQTKQPNPNWVADTSALYPYSMTAVLGLPAELQKDMTGSDQMAAFVGDDCRGVSVIVNKDSTTPVFYILIRGSASEQSKVSFRYYNTKKSYLFDTEAFLAFSVDDNYGIVDQPALPEFKAIN